MSTSRLITILSPVSYNQPFSMYVRPKHHVSTASHQQQAINSKPGVDKPCIIRGFLVWICDSRATAFPCQHNIFLASHTHPTAPTSPPRAWQMTYRLRPARRPSPLLSLAFRTMQPGSIVFRAVDYGRKPSQNLTTEFIIYTTI